ncbi:MAG: alpha/beta fold hydrolase [Acidobacteriota bacterium]|nr:alpha/beta fold hydrolase [Acidobacteriota bacterium]
MINTIESLVLRDGSGEEFVASFFDGGRDSGVVLVHGILCDRRLGQIGRLAGALSEDHDVLSIDVRGHGDTPGFFTWGREEWRQVSAAAEHLAGGGRRVTVIGFSFGGYNAAKAASRGAKVDRLILVGAPVDLHVLDHWPINRDFLRHLPVVLRRKRRMTRLGWPTGLRQRALTREELERIEATTLVIHGGGDWLVSRRHAERYARLIPRARLHEVEGGFHAEFMLDSSPEAFMEAVLPFVGGVIP